MPDNSYNVDIIPSAALISNATFSVVSQSTTQVVVKVTAGVLVSLGSMVTVIASK